MTLTIDWTAGIPADGGKLLEQLTGHALARHERRMEIADTYRDYGQNAWEMLESDGVMLAEVEDALGEEAYAEYATFLYLNVK